MPDVRNKLSLIISSNQHILNLVGDQLALAGWYTEKAETVPQALELLHRTKWQLIFFSRTLHGQPCLPVEQRLERLQPNAHFFLLMDAQSCNTTESPVRDIFCEVDLSANNEQAGINTLRIWLPLVDERIAELKDAVILPIEKYTKSPIVGECQAIQKARRQIDVLAHTSEPCLITGENGTGKLSVARAIHERRCGSDEPMVLIMCEEENENFDTVRRSLLSEVMKKKECGSILLSQLDAASDRLQAALLDLDYEVSAYMKIIASSCHNLQEMVEQGRFSVELYNRLKNYIYLPSLKERREDIGLLIAHFVEQFVNKSYVRVSQQAWKLLQEYEWKFNLPELHNVAINAVASGAGAICLMDIPLLTKQANSAIWKPRR